jgi:hypothetical protein
MENDMAEITLGTEDCEEEVFDFSSPELVLVEVLAHDNADRSRPEWKFHTLETCTVIGGADPNVTGAASYEASYGGFLDYTVKGLVECPGEGWWVVEDVTGTYHCGEWGFTDDDMEFCCGKVRPATAQEVAEA